MAELIRLSQIEIFYQIISELNEYNTNFKNQTLDKRSNEKWEMTYKRWEGIYDRFEENLNRLEEITNKETEINTFFSH